MLVKGKLLRYELLRNLILIRTHICFHFEMVIAYVTPPTPQQVCVQVSNHIFECSQPQTI